MSRFVLLDTGVLGIVTNPNLSSQVQRCHSRIFELARTGDSIVVPEICDYELRRELLRAKGSRGLPRLDELIDGCLYLAINTSAMRLAAQIWAKARSGGYPTAAKDALDADVILAAQALQAKLDFELDVIVATTNVEHLGRYVTALHWEDIQPSQASD